MEQQRVGRLIPGIPADALNIVMSYIDDPKDRATMSLVCKLWHEIDTLTRKHVTIGLCYTTTPKMLQSRFKHLESLKLKGKPMPSCDMFHLIPDYWGGDAGPWVKEIAKSFKCLNSIHFRGMVVMDSDLKCLLRTRGKVLLTLKMDRCSGFSTDGLFKVGRYCRKLKHLCLEDSDIEEKDGNWLHELATNNKGLETLNFQGTSLVEIEVADLELLARNCLSLCSLKLSYVEILDLARFFQTATNLEEFAGGSFYNESDYSSLSLPQNLCKLGLNYLEKEEMHMVFPLASRLKKLDFLDAFLDQDDYCDLLQQCPNLECLQARNDLGDRGLEVLSQICKRLKKLRIDRFGDETVTQIGLIALAQGCFELEYLEVHVSDITNNALECMGTHSKNLCDFRLVLLDEEAVISDLPLDQGVRALLMGCEKLRKFALYIRPGGLTDDGLRCIGQYGQNLRKLLLGCVGDSDAGLLEFSRGCPNLQRIEMRDCIFSEHALAVAVAVMRFRSLRFFWVQGNRDFSTTPDLLAMVRPYWNIELVPAMEDDGSIVETEVNILAYYSLAGQRTDFPSTVKPFDPISLQTIHP